MNSVLLQEKQEKLRALLYCYSDCFSLTSKLRQTSLAKHRIIAEEALNHCDSHFTACLHTSARLSGRKLTTC